MSFPLKSKPKALRTARTGEGTIGSQARQGSKHAGWFKDAVPAWGLVSPCPSGTVGSFFLHWSGREWTSELLSPQMLLLASSSATQKSQGKGYTCFSLVSNPAFLLFWFFLIYLQVLSAQGTIQESISATSSLHSALLLAALPD